MGGGKEGGRGRDKGVGWGALSRLYELCGDRSSNSRIPLFWRQSCYNWLKLQQQFVVVVVRFLLLLLFVCCGGAGGCKSVNNVRWSGRFTVHILHHFVVQSVGYVCSCRHAFADVNVKIYSCGKRMGNNLHR